MNWIVNQLFGAQTSAHLGDKVTAAVAAYLLSQPTATIDQIKALVISRADSLIAGVVTFIPSWARPLLTPLLDSAVAGLVDSAYKSLAKQVPATASASPASA